MTYPIGAIPLTGFIGTTDITDVFPTHLDFLGYGGMRTVADNTERDAITLERRAFGMLVFSVGANAGVGACYVLANIAMGGNSNVLTDNLNWIVFSGGGGGSVISVTGNAPINIDNTDPTNPIVNLDFDSTLFLNGSGELSVVGTGTNDFVLPVKVTTVAVLPGAPVYNNGAAGVGATLTRSSNGTLGTIDGVSVFSVSDRILVKDQVSQLTNGVYEITALGSGGTPYILTRTTDSDATAELDDQIVAAAMGTINQGVLFAQQTLVPVVGTDPIVYLLVSNVFVKQQSSGTQTKYNIAMWTGNKRTLYKGTLNFQYDYDQNIFHVGDISFPLLLTDPIAGNYIFGPFGDTYIQHDIGGGNGTVGYSTGLQWLQAVAIFGQTFIQMGDIAGTGGLTKLVISDLSGHVELQSGGYGFIADQPSQTMSMLNAVAGISSVGSSNAIITWGYITPTANKWQMISNDAFQTFGIFNGSDGSKTFFSLDVGNGLFQIGDIDGDISGNQMSIDAANKVTYFTDTSGDLKVGINTGAPVTTHHVDGIGSVKTGLSSSLPATVGGSKIDFIADSGNVTTGETDLYTYTTPASSLGTNGDKWKAEFGGTFASTALETLRIKLYFAGTVIFDTGALTLSLASSWTMYVTIIRVSSTVVRYMVSLITQGAALAAYTSVGELTGLTLSATNILKITGQAAGAGATTNDIIAKMGTIDWFPAALT